MRGKYKHSKTNGTKAVLSQQWNSRELFYSLVPTGTNGFARATPYKGLKTPSQNTDFYALGRRDYLSVRL